MSAATSASARPRSRCARHSSTPMGGRQVALLCPTTVLAQQHFNTFSARFAGYPLTVRAMSRFESKAEHQNTLKGLKRRLGGRSGSARIACCPRTLHFKRLGLLVVDEEQRFGVTHKERIKQMRMSVDVLTLSATPIPRTLQLAVGGMRDMSIITTPPVDRRAFRTVVSQYDPGMVKEANQPRARSRWTGVLRVQPRRRHLRARRAHQRAAAQRARGGGSWTNERERTRADHARLRPGRVRRAGGDRDHREWPRYPRANTIIVDRADLFGCLSSISCADASGRANERAYAYLLVPPASQLSDEARSRNRGPRALYRARLRLSHRDARYGAARRGRLAGRRSERLRRERRLRFVLQDARRRERTSCAAKP